MGLDAERDRSDALVAIGARLRSLRIERGYSMRDVATRADLSASFIGLVERGESEIAITRLMRLVDVYGVTVADVLGDAVGSERGRPARLADARSISADDGRVEILYLSVAMPNVEPFRLVLSP